MLRFPYPTDFPKYTRDTSVVYSLFRIFTYIHLDKQDVSMLNRLFGALLADCATIIALFDPLYIIVAHSGTGAADSRIQTVYNTDQMWR